MDYRQNPPAPRRNPFAIVSLVLGIGSLLTICTGFLPLPMGALGILFAVLSYRRGRRLDSMALTGAVTSCVGLLFSLVLYGMVFAMLPSLLRAGVRVWHQPPPFAHTKLLAVDGYYAQIGSANLDARSLRLNFELNMEVFDPHFHVLLVRHMEDAMRRGREMTLARLASRSLPLRLRDAACWLFSPYL